MERSIKVSLEKAREWYNSGNESLREVALQAFKEDELIGCPWKLIKTFEDACAALNINPDMEYLGRIFDNHLQNMYKLKVIKKALNGVEWEPDLNTGIIYYPWLRYYPKDSSYNSSWVPVANFRAKEDNKIYILVSRHYGGYDGGLGSFGCGYGDGYGDVGAFRGLLGCKSKEIAKYFGKTFGKLIFDVIYGQYNNYTWVEK